MRLKPSQSKMALTLGTLTLFGVGVMAWVVLGPGRTSGFGHARGELIVGFRTEAAECRPECLREGIRDPTDTGIASIDSLNRKYSVQEMVRVFPEVNPTDEIARRYGLALVFKLTVPKTINLETMAVEYSSNPFMSYAEVVRRYESRR